MLTFAQFYFIGFIVLNLWFIKKGLDENIKEVKNQTEANIMTLATLTGIGLILPVWLWAYKYLFNVV